MTLEEDQELGRAGFWDGRYAQSTGDEPTHEWLSDYPKLEAFFQRNLFTKPGLTVKDNPRIMHPGSGDSLIPVELAKAGYKNQLCVDFSPVVVQLMGERHSQYEGIEWKELDLRNMPSIEDKSIDVAFDKGTIDAMIYGSPWNPPDEVKKNTSDYLREIHRVLKDDGVLLCVSFRQPHFMKPLLHVENLWNVDVQTIGDGGAIDPHGYVLTKAL